LSHFPPTLTSAQAWLGVSLTFAAMMAKIYFDVKLGKGGKGSRQ
jgi:hypothetical protein